MARSLPRIAGFLFALLLGACTFDHSGLPLPPWSSADGRPPDAPASAKLDRGKIPRPDGKRPVDAATQPDRKPPPPRDKGLSADRPKPPPDRGLPDRSPPPPKDMAVPADTVPWPPDAPPPDIDPWPWPPPDIRPPDRYASCGALYGKVDGYHLCNDLGDRCRFFRKTGMFNKKSCNDICGGNRCVKADDTNSSHKCRSDSISCSDKKEDSTCTCRKY